MIEFPNASFDSSKEYKEFILSHDNAVKTERLAFVEAAKAGKKVIPYSSSCPEDEPNREDVVYFEFVDSDLNIYVEFFNRDTQEWIESYCFRDADQEWTILCDNVMYGNPLGLEDMPTIRWSNFRKHDPETEEPGITVYKD